MLEPITFPKERAASFLTAELTPTIVSGSDVATAMRTKLRANLDTPTISVRAVSFLIKNPALLPRKTAETIKMTIWINTFLV